MKKLFVALFLIGTIQISVWGQSETFIIQGTIIDAASDDPIPYATVMVNDKQTQRMLTGTSTEEDGSFRVTTSTTDIVLQISFMGFESKTITDLDFDNGMVSLGAVRLETNSQVLDEIMVVGE